MSPSGEDADYTRDFEDDPDDDEDSEENAPQVRHSDSSSDVSRDAAVPSVGSESSKVKKIQHVKCDQK